MKREQTKSSIQCRGYKETQYNESIQDIIKNDRLPKPTIDGKLLIYIRNY